MRSQTETAKRYRYTGKERDEESGFYYHGARYYAAWLGKWTSCDPVDSIEAATKRYSYGKNSPLVFYDPSGLDDQPGALSKFWNWLNKPISETTEKNKEYYQNFSDRLWAQARSSGSFWDYFIAGQVANENRVIQGVPNSVSGIVLTSAAHGASVYVSVKVGARGAATPAARQGEVPEEPDLGAPPTTPATPPAAPATPPAAPAATPAPPATPPAAPATPPAPPTATTLQAPTPVSPPSPQINQRLVDRLAKWKTYQAGGGTKTLSQWVGATQRQYGGVSGGYASGYQAWDKSVSGRVHGNSLQSKEINFIYELWDDVGGPYKPGITQDPVQRQSHYRRDPYYFDRETDQGSFLFDPTLKVVGSGSRRDVAWQEDILFTVSPGPASNERGAGLKIGSK